MTRIGVRIFLGQRAKYPLEFLIAWSDTLACDGYDKAMAEHRRVGAARFAPARRKFDELLKDNLSPVGTQAIQRIAALHNIELTTLRKSITTTSRI